ncbi:hypothetical protein EVAR_37804_1 [Eumeta japonica]|uniref:Uncharacterized protein n=1 Tax=Eumeta variegata TaxID=151549 RepID=A0A4C1W7N3_EUMVA|nr:hypothetical protein EVAR_37804_1 [Eumeta japonica]
MQRLLARPEGKFNQGRLDHRKSERSELCGLPHAASPVYKRFIKLAVHPNTDPALNYDSGTAPDSDPGQALIMITILHIISRLAPFSILVLIPLSIMLPLSVSFSSDSAIG